MRLKKSTFVEMKGITKSFPGIVANDNVNLSLNYGEIHVLLGENGAGKSTLMSVLSGIYKPDSGEIFIDGKKAVFHCPKDAIKHGVGMVHQHFKLVQAFNVAENVVLGAKKYTIVDNAQIEREVSEFAKEFGIEIDVKAKISQLSIGEQQRVEILKAIYRNAQMLVLDEPTAVLTPQEAEKLFDTLRMMASLGKAIVVITHKLAEVMAIADRVTILRQGKVTATLDKEEINPTILSEKLIGDCLTMCPTAVNESGEAVLMLKNVSALNERGASALSDVSFTLKSGEIVGVAGVSGNGQKELLEVIAGVRKIVSGEILIRSGEELEKIHNMGVKKALHEGIAFIPEDRLGMGLVGNMDMSENMFLRADTKNFLVPFGKMDKLSEKAVSQHEISVANVRSPIRLLSGGNLQKVLVARETAQNPKVLLVAYPSRGLDISATDKVYNSIADERAAGCGVLMVSEDLDSLICYSDRILVMCGGEISGILKKHEATPAKIGILMMGGEIS